MTLGGARGTRTRTGVAAARRTLAVVPALLAALAFGCARVGPPGGGPEDSTPPAVSETVPGDGETLVAPDTEIRVEFSEEMNRISVERAFAVAPELKLKNLRWDGRTLVAPPEEALAESTTYTVEVAGTAQDYHGVSMPESHSFMFSTGPTLNTGRIDGLVTMARDPVPGATVWACAGAVEPDSLGVIARCGYGTTATPAGSFLIAGVRTRSTPYVLIAFIDLDEDGAYDTNEEPGRVSDAAALVDESGESASGLAIEIEDPHGGETPAGEE